MTTVRPGTGCVLPQLEEGGFRETTFGGGFCGDGVVDTTVAVEGDVDAKWAYMMVGVGSSGASIAAERSVAKLPALN